MGTTSERKPDGTEELSNDALIRRSAERLRELRQIDPDLVVSAPSPAAIEEIQQCPTTIETVVKAFELYADRPCFGERAYEVGCEGIRLLPALRTLRYRDVWARIEAFASGLAHEGLIAPGDFLGICGFGSIDWVVSDYAALHRSAVSVPLQTNMSPADLQQIIRETELRCLVCSAEQIDAVDAVLPHCPSVSSVVVMDLHEGDRAMEAKIARRKGEPGPRIITMAEIETVGREKGPLPKVLPSERGEAEPLMTLMYTSGSTGTPKGAMYTERLYRNLWQTGFSTRLVRVLPELPTITLDYMPLNHGAGRNSINSAIVRGGFTGFVAKSDMSTLFEDLQLVRPTTLFLVPRVAATIYQHYQGELVRRTSGIKDAAERDRLARDLMLEMRNTLLGARFLLANVGAAPTPPEIVTFLKRCFQVPIIDVYGSTEAGPLTFDNRVDGDVGLAWKLVDVPELGYHATDKPYPRGELHVSSRFVVPGYYKNERATKDLFDEEGMLNTGDIVEQRGPDSLVWIDRGKNVLKLAQGEFVATSRLEGLYASGSPFIRQIFVYGDGFHAFLVAVVVPDLEAASEYLQAHGSKLDDTSLKNLIRSDISRVATEAKVRGHEVPRDFIIERDPFTVERGLLTDSNKQSRPRLHARYGREVDELYASIERAQAEALYGLGGRGSAASVAEKVRRAMAVTLGVSDLDVKQADQSFIQLGGDSLSAVRLESLLHEITGVRVPVGLLISPTSSVRSVVDYVEKAVESIGQRAGAPKSATFSEVHGAGAKEIHERDIRVEKFLAASEIDAARQARPASELPPSAEVALLTGANGFLGRFLTLELLERLSGVRKLYTIVRAPNDAAARERLAACYRTDPALAQRFDELSAAGGHLVVLAGDLMKPQFGLDPDVYARMEEEVDLVVHNGALVNHALGYEQLFEPNVLGTVEVLRFALGRRLKTLSYVSTVGVFSKIAHIETLYDDEDLRALIPELPTQSGYAAGYGASKWASELLLHDAHDKLGLPVLIFRPSEIMAHDTYRGQVNVPDFFTRLLAGIVYTGLAPRSFYPETEREKRFDGMPVNCVARSIVAPSIHRPAGATRFESFNVVNPHHDDGVSLDVIVHWVKTAGYAVKRIADYDEWFTSFRERLMALPEPKKQHSPLAIIDAWSRPQALERSIDNQLLLARLRAISPELAEIPHISEALIHRTLDDMAIQHVIDRPLRLAG